ncbi:hypothetical protein ABTK34_19360, partial [Acinetobacter baumannii]
TMKRPKRTTAEATAGAASAPVEGGRDGVAKTKTGRSKTLRPAQPPVQPVAQQASAPTQPVMSAPVFEGQQPVMPDYDYGHQNGYQGEHH